MASSDIGSGDVRYGVISQGQGLALWHRRIGTGRCERVGLRIPDLQVFEDSFDHIDIVDVRDDAHVAAADNTRKRVDLRMTREYLFPVSHRPPNRRADS